MPAPNRVKEYAPDSYYHVFNRGVAKQIIFKDSKDYSVFLNLFKRYLSPDPVKDLKGRQYPHLRGDIELLAFCIMPNHFHLLVFQAEDRSLTRLLSGVCTSYAVYFNKKYRRVGPIFQDIYKAVKVQNDAQLMHVSRYIHLNPEDYLIWQASSAGVYLGLRNLDWLQSEKVMGLFEGVGEYKRFLNDHRDYENSLNATERLLAGY